MDGGEIQCELCPHRCRVAKGKRGICRVRENRDGKYYSLVYGNPCAVHLDPIEKKPFFHVLPGTTSFSLATAGCNFQCKFCQNWEISQAFPEDVYSLEFPPEMVVRKAKEMRAHSVAYTYVEPTIFSEYMFDTGQLVKKAGLLNVCHSNGFINSSPLRDLCKMLDAANIDLKGFSDTFYHELCSGELNPVLKTLKTLKQEKVHLEITNLVIPTKNDEISLIKEMCLWVKRELGADTPIYFSRFYPLYKLRTLPPTPVSTLEKARATALSTGLEYVYIGNIPGHEGENTFCPRCKKMVIQRTGFMVGEMHLKDGKCGYCGKPIPGIWS
ncbi:MAG: AmmeMemoRadiSam system radical SAM enzyme [Thermodesulfobacteriota bacterium]